MAMTAMMVTKMMIVTIEVVMIVGEDKNMEDSCPHGRGTGNDDHYRVYPGEGPHGRVKFNWIIPLYVKGARWCWHGSQGSAVKALA